MTETASVATMGKVTDADAIERGVVSPLLLKAADLGRLLGCGRSTIWAHHSSGQIPRPVRIGRITRWRRAEIEAWLDAGAPPRGRWENVDKARYMGYVNGR